MLPNNLDNIGTTLFKQPTHSVEDDRKRQPKTSDNAADVTVPPPIVKRMGLGKAHTVNFKLLGDNPRPDGIFSDPTPRDLPNYWADSQSKKDI